MKLTRSRKIMSIDGSSLYKANYINGETFNSKFIVNEFVDKETGEIKTYKKKINYYKGVLNPSLELIRLKELIRDKDTDTEKEKNKKLKQIVKVTFKKKIVVSDKEEISIDKIKEKLYQDGFTIDGKKYVLYKRSGSASRNAIVLFIRDNIFGNMRAGSWLGKEELKADMQYSNMAGFKAYESLSLSTIIDTIRINPKHILLVNDYESIFTKRAMVVSESKDTILKAEAKDYTYHSSIFDGEGLIQKELIGGKSFALLRARWLKSCAFACDIQQFFKDNEITEVTDIFGNKIKADKVELIITPSSLKWLKTSTELFNNDDKECYNYWLDHVGDLFGIVKDGHKSKFGEYQRLTYQQLNAVNLTTEQLTEMLEGEIKYISNIKNDIRYFKEFISKNDNSLVRKAMYNLLSVNTKFKDTDLFKEFKTKNINKYITTLKKGKIKVKGCDYYTVCGNPIELLYLAINKFNGRPIALKDNEIYCKSVEDNTEVAVIRNPCINQGNTFFAVNKHNDDLDKYMVLDGNIVIVNAIESDIDMRCAGMDRDSDEVLIHTNKAIVEQVKENRKYLTPVTDIKADNKLRYWTNIEMCEVDKLISKNYIGKIVNLSQQLNSMYWNEYNKSNRNELKLEELYKLTSLLSIASMLEIDKAKKLLNIEMKDLLRNIKKNVFVDKLLKKNGKQSNTPKNPKFFIATGHKRNRCTYMNCTMDNLYEILSDSDVIKKAEGSTSIEFNSLLKENDNIDMNKANYNQIPNIVKTIETYKKKMDNKRKELAKCDNDFKRTQINADIQELNDNTEKTLQVLKININTVYNMLYNLESKYSSIKTDLLALLYKVVPDLVIECFKENPPINESIIENKDGDIDIWGTKYKTI